MSYSPVTDFIALLRQTSGGVRTERMPGLDYVVAALSRAKLFNLSVSQTQPTANQATTVWFQPSLPSWVAEGTVFLWNVTSGAYEIATPALWGALLGGSGGGGGGAAYKFQSAPNPSNNVLFDTSLLAVQRAAPAATTLVLPSVSTRAGLALQIGDWSTGVANHTITVNAAAGETIMRAPAWQLLSTADQLAGVTLYPSIELSGWVIA